MRVGLGWIFLLLLSSLIACTTPTSTPSPVPISTLPSTTTPTTVPETATALLAINLITPTPRPTETLPLPTEAVTATVPLSATSPSGAVGTPASLSRPVEVGNSAADAALVAVLQSCWHLSDPRLLNGNLTEHRNAYDCARASLTGIAQTYPTYALVHRVIAWGYYYTDNDLPKALQEYQTASQLYHQAGDKVGESEARMRLGLLLVSTNRAQACGELAQAGNLDPTNDRAVTYYNAYACGTTGNLTSGGTPVAPLTVQVNLDQVRGKILFKSDRAGNIAYYVMDRDGANQKQVSGNTYSAAMKWEAWPPDHSRVAVVRSAGFTRKFGYNNDIWVTDPSGGGGRGLENPANDYDPAWSPTALFDGNYWIAFVSNRGDTAHGNTQGEEIWIMHPDATNPFRLTCHGPRFSKHPSWSGDSSSMVFHSNNSGGGNSQIFMMDLGGLGNVSDPCQVGDTAKNISNNSFNDTEPVWVK